MEVFSKIRNLPVMKRLVKKLVEAKSTTQDAYDMYNLSVLFKCYDWHQQQMTDKSGGHITVREKISAEKVHELEEDLKLGNYYDDMSYCQNSSTKQIIRMFRALKANHDNLDHIGSSVNSSLGSAVGFELELRPSKIQVPQNAVGDAVEVVADAGMGVFVKSTGAGLDGEMICPGTVLAIFPGLVHLNEPLPLTSPTKTAMSLSSLFDFNKTIGIKDEYIHRELLPDPNYQLLMRLDGIFIDSRKPCTSAELLSNPYAVANRINHPPLDPTSVGTAGGIVRAQAPNVVQLRYNFEKPGNGSNDGFPVELTPFIPNEYAVKPHFPWLINRSILMHSSIVVACSYIKPGDELYVDYRLGPDLPANMVPSWYRHVDGEGARSRLSNSPRSEGEHEGNRTAAVDEDEDDDAPEGVGGNEWATPFPVPKEPEASKDAPAADGLPSIAGQQRGVPGELGKEERRRLKVVR